MTLHKWTTHLITLLSLGTLLSMVGCTTIISQTVQKALEDRTTEDQATDTKLLTSFLGALSDKDKGLLLDVKIDVWEQRVMLTGTLDDPAVRRDVVALVNADSRVKAVYDEIQVVPTEEQAQRREASRVEPSEPEKDAGGFGTDLIIGGKIKAKLLSTRGIPSVNYRWRSVKQTVYLIGRARTDAELAQVLEIIRQTKHVKSITHFVEIKPPA